MLISVCGTPGVGKTTVSSMFSDQGWKVISEKDLIRDMSLFDEMDTKNDEMIVDLEVVRNGFEKWAEDRTQDTILDGHLSYLAPSDIIFILRLDPQVLKERLSLRNYDQEKIDSNVGSEVIGYLLVKSVEEEQKVIDNNDAQWMGDGRKLVLERDITSLSKDEILGWMLEMIEAFRGKRLKTVSLYRPGKIDWLEAYSQWC